jgi:adenosylcobyric acid synthase
MMGQWMNDPYQVEGQVERIPGLGILPVETTITQEKVTEQCRFRFEHEDIEGEGYEIHMGETRAEKEQPLCWINGEKADGYYLNKKTWGTYIHGIFDNEAVINSILAEFGPGLSTPMDFKAFKEEQYDKLANLIREHVDMDYIYQTMAM